MVGKSRAQTLVARPWAECHLPFSVDLEEAAYLVYSRQEPRFRPNHDWQSGLLEHGDVERIVSERSENLAIRDTAAKRRDLSGPIRNGPFRDGQHRLAVEACPRAQDVIGGDPEPCDSALHHHRGGGAHDEYFDAA